MPESSIEPNRHAAPEADVKHPSSASKELIDVEAIRQRYIRHEAVVKSIGSLCVFLAVFVFCGLTFAIGIRIANASPAGTIFYAEFLAAVVILVILIALARGFAGLRAWARWVATVLLGLSAVFWLVIMATSLLLAPEGSSTPKLLLVLLFAIPVAMIYLLQSKKSAYVFTEGYLRVVRETPQISYKTSRLLLWTFGFAIVFLLALFFLFGSG